VGASADLLRFQRVPGSSTITPKAVLVQGREVLR
jgi:hypothetical protein